MNKKAVAILLITIILGFLFWMAVYCIHNYQSPAIKIVDDISLARN